MPDFNDDLAKAETAYRAGDIDAALTHCRAVLAAYPNQPDALHIMGTVAHQRGNLELALKFIEAALCKRADHALAWLNRALVLISLRRYDEGFTSAAEASRLDPQSGKAWNVMGMALSRMDRHAEAHQCHQQAIRLAPQSGSFYADDALILYGLHDLPGAYAAMRRALQLDDKLLPLTMANILKSAGHPDRGLPFIARARAMAPHAAALTVNEALARLQIGDYEKGFAYLEQRPDFDPHFQTIPLWQGAAIDHLIIHEDQGFGDTLQNLRYLPLLQTRVKNITLALAAPLHKLVARNFPNVAVIDDKAILPPAHARTRLSSLPHFCGTTLATIPTPQSYIVADAALRQTWRQQLAPHAQPRIGIVWGGNPDNLNDRLRSLPAGQVSKLLAIGGPHLIALQKGKHLSDVDLAAHKVFSAAPLLHDFEDTAALMTELDLVITTCTSTAHLAGALGVPTWLLLSFDPHWLWLLGRADSPWYRSMRLFRQLKPFDWSNVIADVGADLQRFLAGDQTVLTPSPYSGAPCTHNPDALMLPEE